MAAPPNPSGSAGQDARLRLLRGMDRWFDPLLVLLAASTVPLIIIETGDPSPDDLRFVVAATWVIWGAFTVNFFVRLTLAVDRRFEFKRLAWDLTLIVGQPLASLGERKAAPGLALVPLFVIGARTFRQGRVLRRTGYRLRRDPIRVVLFFVPLVWLLSAATVWRFERSTGVIDSVGDGLWWSVVTLATVGYGDISPKTTGGRFVAVGVMVVGIGMFSVVTAKLAERLLAHRTAVGRTEVLEKGHTLILGWSPMVLTIVAELVVANRSRRTAAVVVLADMDTEEMHGQIAAHVPELERSNTVLVCRTGNPSDPVDLARCRPDNARSIIVVDPTHEDAPVVRALLALMHGESPVGRIPVVANIDDPSTAAALDVALQGRVTVVNPTSFIARTAAQACRSAGVAHTYQDLLGFSGSELYRRGVPPAAVGHRFGELLNGFPDACAVGLIDAHGVADLNPPMDTVVDEHHELVMIALDEAEVRFDGAQPVSTAIEPPPVPPSPEQVVVFGWNPLGPIIVRELDGFLAPGSQVTVVADASLADLHDVPSASLTNASVEVREAVGADYAALVELIADRHADHALVLCYRSLPVAEADARALVTTLQVRQAIGPATGEPDDTTVVTELLDQRDVALAPPEAAGDFLVSDRLISLLLTQLSEDAEMKVVFDDLLDPEGAEVYCKPAVRYLPEGGPVTFAAIVDAARLRGETAIGYREVAASTDAGRAFGIVVNPPKSQVVELARGDEIIVVAEDDR